MATTDERLRTPQREAVGLQVEREQADEIEQRALELAGKDRA
jgi:hypothetical protein